MLDPYTVLGVSRTAKPEEIKSAFRMLAKKYHPDHNKDNLGAKEQFSKINQAYEIIGNKDQRARFDCGAINAEGKPVLHSVYQGRENKPFNGFSDQRDKRRKHSQFWSSHSNSGFSINDLLSQGIDASGFDFSNAHSRKQGCSNDVAITLSVSLEQAVGVEKVEVVFSDGKRLQVKLPSFVEDGKVIRLKGQGARMRGSGGSVDALFTIHLIPHARFRRDGRALHLDLPVSLRTAVSGGQKEVDTLDGRVIVTVPAWSGSDRVLRLKDKGLPLKDGSRAPLYIHIRVMLPKKYDLELEKLVNKYRDQTDSF
ncbi:MAG: Heat shock protein DnaJ [Candidatus Tokpelaia sp. JSC085]|nr:MAG: Heat shock protein DnaJ [Candidatus Tokpelaia sp. JSC085]